MRLIALAVLVGVAAAVESLVVQGYEGDNNRILKHATEIPVCANLCIFQAAIAVGCNPDDYHCQCSSKRLQIYTLTENCLGKSCTPAQSRDAHQLTNKICKAVADGVRNPTFKPPGAAEKVEEAEEKKEVVFPDAPIPEGVVFPDAPIPEGVVFPDAPISAPAADAAPAAPIMRRGLAAEPQFAPIPAEQRAPVEVRAPASASGSFAASSIPSVVATATATTSPSTVATAGAALHKAPSYIAGVGAIAAAALMI